MVSGTGGRTIKSSAALALVVGLALAAAPPTHAAATPAEAEPTPTATTEPTEQEDAEPEPETTGTATQTPPPDETDPVTDPEVPEDEETEDDPDQGQPGDGETDEGQPGDDQTGEGEQEEPTPGPGSPPATETPSPDPETPTRSPPPGPPTTSPSPSPSLTQPPGTPQDPAESGLSCEGAGVNPGETVTVTCTAPEGSTLELGSTNSAIGGTVEISGFDITYTAPSAVDGTPSDPFTVIAGHPDGSSTSTQVAFSVYGTVNGDDGAEPTQSLPPVPPDATEESTPAPTETAAAAPPGTPTGGGLPNLPIPGLPASPWDNLPTETEEPEAGSHTTHQSDDEKAEDTEADDPEDLLAQTGPEQAAWAGSLAIASILLGAAALRMSRRCTQ